MKFEQAKKTFSHTVMYRVFCIGLQCGFILSQIIAPPEPIDLYSNEDTRLKVNFKCPDPPPRTCKDVKSKEPRAIVTLSDGYEVLCDTQTDGGGWIVIQRRLNGEVDFYRNWTDYKNGFGNITGNFWFGNEKIHRLTFLRRYQLRVDFTFSGTKYHSTYSHFRLHSEGEKYQIDVRGYFGDGGDSLTHHQGMAFTTVDRDNDKNKVNCAKEYHGAWWYTTGHKSNLNGKWGSKKYGEGLTWVTRSTFHSGVNSSEMKIRPIY